MAQPTQPDPGDEQLIDLPPWSDERDGLDELHGHDDDLPFLGCASTGQPCRLAPVPEGATTAISVQLPQDRPVYVALRRVPADRCLDCGAVSFDLLSLMLADAALTRLLREDGTSSRTAGEMSSWSLTSALRERLRAGIDYGDLVPPRTSDTALAPTSPSPASPTAG